MWIFTTLMTMRAARISAWHVYMDHLVAKEMKNGVWTPERVQLLVAMLAKMAKFLDYDFGLLDQKNGIDSPVAGEIAWGVNGGGLGIVGSLLDPKSPYTVKPENSEFKPWQDSGTAADWLRAAGCKP